MKTRVGHIRFRWIVLALIGLCVLIMSQSKPACALWGKAHRVAVLYRVDAEILSKTEAGLYYRDLFWKHNPELIQIYIVNNPDKYDDFLAVVDMFVPALEALVDGHGDNIRLTAEQIEAVEAELDWLFSVASPAFQQDIVKEQTRWPLSEFVGMTMTEVWEYVNTRWTPDEP